MFSKVNFILYLFLANSVTYGGQFIDVDGHLYNMQYFLTTWHNAQRYCLNQNMMLVTILSSDEQARVTLATKKFNQTLSAGFWIGLTNEGEQPYCYYWHSVGLAPLFTNWAPNEGQNTSSEFCVVTTTSDLKWYSRKCTEKRPFLCKKKLIYNEI